MVGAGVVVVVELVVVVEVVVGVVVDVVEVVVGVVVDVVVVDVTVADSRIRAVAGERVTVVTAVPSALRYVPSSENVCEVEGLGLTTTVPPL
jgi:hypothetical protein